MVGYGENRGIKKYLKSHHGRLPQEGRLADFRVGFRDFVSEEIKAQGYIGGRWAVKHSVHYFPVWGEFAPKFICIRRGHLGILKSTLKTRMYNPIRNPEEISQLIQWQIDLMDKMDCPQVDMDQVLSGNFETMAQAIESVGLDFNPSIANQMIDQEKWHHRTTDPGT